METQQPKSFLGSLAVGPILTVTYSLQPMPGVHCVVWEDLQQDPAEVGRSQRHCPWLSAIRPMAAHLTALLVKWAVISQGQQSQSHAAHISNFSTVSQ